MDEAQNEKSVSLSLIMICLLFCLCMMIGWCRAWFGSALSGSEQSGFAQSGSAFHMHILSW